MYKRKPHRSSLWGRVELFYTLLLGLSPLVTRRQDCRKGLEKVFSRAWAVLIFHPDDLETSPDSDTVLAAKFRKLDTTTVPEEIPESFGFFLCRKDLLIDGIDVGMKLPTGDGVDQTLFMKLSVFLDNLH